MGQQAIWQWGKANGGGMGSKVAERVGFEPTVRLPLRQFSRLFHSTALASLRDLGYYTLEKIEHADPFCRQN